MTSKAKPSRPLWRGMGLWKWPSILLLLFCVGIVYPYASGSGGSNGVSAAHTAAALHGCRVDYEVRKGEGTVTVLGRIAPQCAAALSRPVLAFIDETGATVTQTAMRGGPNSLRGRLAIPGDFDADHMKLAIASTNTNGAAAYIDATAHLAAQTIADKQEN